MVVAINQFASDTKAELDFVTKICAEQDVCVALSNHWERGGEGAMLLADLVVRTIEKSQAKFKVLYPNALSFVEKVRTIAQQIYGADDVEFPKMVLESFEELEQRGYRHFPICMAKTQYSFSTDPSLKGVPSGFTIPIREVRPSLGAEFIVVLTGDIMTMPGLPRVPAAEAVGVDASGDIVGLF